MGGEVLKSVALILFILMYAIIILKQKYRVHAVLAAALLYLLSGVLPLSAVIPSINWNVLLMISGTMVIVYFFIESKMPNLLADLILDRCRNVCHVIIFMSLFAGAISAFIDNVATVLMVAPVALVICKKLKISPLPMVLSIAVSSNLQGAATLVGDTTSIMLGDFAKMDFLDFFFMKGRPGIFFAVELGALLTVPIMLFLFRKLNQPVQAEEHSSVEDIFPSAALISVVILLILASFIPNKPDITNGLICCTLGLICCIHDLRHQGNAKRVQKALLSVDFETLLLLFGLFLVIRGITEAGIISDISALIVKLGGSNLFLLYTIVVWGSVFFSAFIDNIPYVATLLPILQGVTQSLGISPYLLYFGLLTGATLGGNITPIGASANIAATGILKREGYETSFSDFMKIGIPFTLTAVMSGYLFLWLFWR